MVRRKLTPQESHIIARSGYGPLHLSACSRPVVADDVGEFVRDGLRWKTNKRTRLLFLGADRTTVQRVLSTLDRVFVVPPVRGLEIGVLEGSTAFGLRSTIFVATFQAMSSVLSAFRAKHFGIVVVVSKPSSDTALVHRVLGHFRSARQLGYLASVERGLSRARA